MKNNNVVNIAGYRFIDLPDRDELRSPFLDRCEESVSYTHLTLPTKA